MNCMADFILVLSLFTLPSALPEFTVSPANLVTARTMGAPATPPNAFKERRTEVGLGFRLKHTAYTIHAVSGEINCVTGGTPESNCELLEILRDDHLYMDNKHLRMANLLKEIEAEVLESLGQLQEVRGDLLSRPSRSTGASRICETLHNATRHLSQEIDMIKTRQAYAAALGTLQLLFVITYLIVKIIIFVVKTVRKHNAKRHKEELELMESRLASRKEKRRSAPKHRSGEEGSPPPAPTQL